MGHKIVCHIPLCTDISFTVLWQIENLRLKSNNIKAQTLDGLPFVHVTELRETDGNDVVIVSRNKNILPAEHRIGRSPEKEIGSKLLQSWH